jgi:hypothetical protein
MTITAVPQPNNVPPRTQITIATPSGDTITAVALLRSANGSTVQTRVQPAPGPSPIVLFDYEPPRETPLTYTATVTHGGTTDTYVSAPVTLTPPYPVATHPTTPALSVVLDRASFDFMGVVSIGDETRAALTTKHRILGAEFQVVTKTGPRAAATFQLQVATVTAQERAALAALVRDQTPLFISVPSAWGWDWEDGYYDVGDVGVGRIIQYGPEPRRVTTLALERVEAPAGTQQSPRTWTDVVNDFATWADVAAAYATWTDVLTDSRR